EDVQRLNTELRLQIGDRSNKLARALGRIADERRKPSAELQPGYLLGGRYRIVKALGSGGMGTVYHAERVSDGQKVAIKVVQGAASASLLARFAQEGEVAAAIDHPNVVAILDIDITDEGE